MTSLLLCASLLLPSAPLPDKATAPTVAVVLADGTMASGTVILHKDSPHILTAAHVVASAMKPRKVIRLGPDGLPRVTLDRTPLPVTVIDYPARGSSVQRRAQVILYDQAADLALLRPLSRVEGGCYGDIGRWFGFADCRKGGWKRTRLRHTGFRIQIRKANRGKGS